jgi:hypothetical protein
MNGFSLSNGTYIRIRVVLDDFCLSPAKFSYVIIYIRNVERQMQIANRRAPVKIANSAENSILQALQFQ